MHGEAIKFKYDYSFRALFDKLSYSKKLNAQFQSVIFN